MKSYIAKPAEVERKWYVIDAEGMVFGRLASQVASMLRGTSKKSPGKQRRWHPLKRPGVRRGAEYIV